VSSIFENFLALSTSDPRIELRAIKYLSCPKCFPLSLLLRFRFHSRSSMRDPVSVRLPPKDMYFEAWNVDRQPSYCILSHLPPGTKPADIAVEITPESDCIDPATAMLRLRGIENWVDCIVRVRVHGPFTLYDSFITYTMPSPQNDESLATGCESALDGATKCEPALGSAWTCRS
jgi:hypothetical protein